MDFSLKQIGTVCCEENEFYIKLDPEYREGLTGLEGFEYIQVIWWFDGCDSERCRSVLTEDKPYVKGPEVLGTFATRSPERPNPIAISPSYVTFVDVQNGIVGLAWIDADDGTPVLDIKPYIPSMDRVENPLVPSWCAHWPKNVETSGDFNWSKEFNF